SLGVSLCDRDPRLGAWHRRARCLGGAAGSAGSYAPVRPTRALGVTPMIAATAELLPDRLVVGAALFVGNATGAKFDESAVTRYHLIDGYVGAPEAVIAAGHRLRGANRGGASPRRVTGAGASRARARSGP